MFAISYVYRALDDSTQAVQLPVQQIERMQKVIDAWETQVGVLIHISDVFMHEYNTYVTLSSRFRPRTLRRS
jgi:hypothetical protein